MEFLSWGFSGAPVERKLGLEEAEKKLRVTEIGSILFSL
jgi:hypothetical protein